MRWQLWYLSKENPSLRCHFKLKKLEQFIFTITELEKEWHWNVVKSIYD